MKHVELTDYLKGIGFNEEDAKTISKAIPVGSFSSTDQVTQLIGRALVEQMKHKRFTVKQFAQYLSQHNSITNARKYLAEGSIERANTVPILAGSIEDRIR